MLAPPRTSGETGVTVGRRLVGPGQLRRAVLCSAAATEQECGVQKAERVRRGAEWVRPDSTRADTGQGAEGDLRQKGPAPPSNSAPGWQVPAPEEPLHGPGRGMVHLCLSRVEHAAPADLRGQAAVTQ